VIGVAFDTILTTFDSLEERGLFVARVNFHQKIIIESNVPSGQQAPVLVLGAASEKTEASGTGNRTGRHLCLPKLQYKRMILLQGFEKGAKGSFLTW
jgi:hypothetical protein